LVKIKGRTGGCLNGIPRVYRIGQFTPSGPDAKRDRSAAEGKERARARGTGTTLEERNEQRVRERKRKRKRRGTEKGGTKRSAAMAAFGGEVRAFSLVPVIKSLAKDRPATQVACVQVWEDALWVGTTDG
jgi:hypothetical protein